LGYMVDHRPHNPRWSLVQVQVAPIPLDTSYSPSIDSNIL
jgi:hypothetical protein